MKLLIVLLLIPLRIVSFFIVCLLMMLTGLPLFLCMMFNLITGLTYENEFDKVMMIFINFIMFPIELIDLLQDYLLNKYYGKNSNRM